VEGEAHPATAIIRRRRPDAGEEGVGERNILLVEDDEDQVILAMRALRKHGIVAEVDDVVISGTGEDALDYMFGSGPYSGRDTSVIPEFVLLDVNLPNMGGLQVLERLREDQRTHLVPVILFSSSNKHKDVVKGYELGANSYVTKPADFGRFSEAMQYLGWYWLNFNETP
jgi:two-component system, response regulator